MLIQGIDMELKEVDGHIEVYQDNVFILSGDSIEEVLKELERVVI